MYDYDVGKLLDEENDHSLIYIKERDIADSIVDTSGFRWTYTGNTKTITEYVKRPDEKPDHVVNNVTAFPEVIGKVPLLDGSGTKDSKFLEFYVYNEYKRKTYPVYIEKLNDNLDTYLQGAKFNLYGPYETSQTNPDKDNKLVNKDYEIVTDANGKALVSEALSDNSFYYLYEIEAPAGYNLLSSPIEISVDSRREDNQEKDAVHYKHNGVDNAGSLINVTIGGEQTSAFQITITNTPGVELPMTGGSCSESFCTIGGLMMLVSGILIIRRRSLA